MVVRSVLAAPADPEGPLARGPVNGGKSIQRKQLVEDFFYGAGTVSPEGLTRRDEGA
jgi:hypothetical protein